MFTHLHVHTEYSLLDGMCRIDQLVARAKELGMSSLAITDHGSIYGVIEFYRSAREAGIKPIIGSEVYVAQGSHLGRSPADKNHNHLVLLAKNKVGYQNLLQLTTKAHLEGFYYKPKVDKELLQEFHEGLIAFSACTGGEIPQLILNGRLPEAKEAARWYKQTFGDFYLEIQRHPLPELEAINRNLISMSAELDIPLVATNDVHYLNREDARAHDLLLCIGTNASVQDEKRMKMPGDFFYFKSPEEMSALYRDLPQALENTDLIAEMCDVTLDFGRLHLPEIELPPGKTPDQYLSDLCHQNLRRYYPNLTPEIEQRLDYELDVIQKTQFANYFLVVWDIVSFTRKSGIMFGVRGSAAASIVLHCLGITELDPIENKLVFERFLNIERREMPDIDLDFQDDRRDEVIAYVTRKYGQDHVAQIITFGTLGAKAAIRDVGRALGMPYGDVDRVARLVPNTLGINLAAALQENGELSSIYHEDKIVRNLVDSARRVEGIARHASTHAAGVVISKEPLTRYVPLQRGSSKVAEQESVMTQFSMGDIAKIGLLKMDFLGLANLSILGKAIEIIRLERGNDIDLHKIPMDDRKTFDLLSAGETAGVFQLEGSGMRRYIKQLKPTVFSDIAAMVALYRPGPMEHIPTFIRAKHGEEPIRYLHPALEKILKETYGVIVYQEQVLFIVRELAGYSLGQADVFRKAMGKKIAEVMQKEKQNFLTGAQKKGFSADVAAQVFALIEPFAGYAFNKAHAFSYALIAYETAYLKANYPAEYMTAFLTTHAGVMEKVAGGVAECYRLGLNVLQPDINHSQVNFSIEKTEDGAQAIRFGLAAIKNVGIGAVEPVVAERTKNGEFKSVEDFGRRCDLHSANRRVMESLIKAGALDGLGERATLLNNVGVILSVAQREQKLRESGQSSMFDLWGQAAPTPMPPLELSPVEASGKDKPLWEKELLGVTFSEKPFSPSLGEGVDSTLCGEIEEEMEGRNVVVAGRVASVRELFTRDHRPFASVVLADISGQIEVMVWPKVYVEKKDLFQEGSEVVVEGKVKVKDDRVQLGCDHVRRYQPVVKSEETPQPEKTSFISAAPAPAPTRRLVISISQTTNKENDLALFNSLRATLQGFPGQDEVMLIVWDDGDILSNVKLGSTKFCPELQEKLAGLVGKDAFRLEAR